MQRDDESIKMDQARESRTVAPAQCVRLWRRAEAALVAEAVTSPGLLAYVCMRQLEAPALDEKLARQVRALAVNPVQGRIPRHQVCLIVHLSLACWPATQCRTVRSMI